MGLGSYRFWIALRSIRTHAGLSLLIVSGVALGVALCTLFAAIRHAYAQDPLPGKSARVHAVRLDNWNPLREFPGSGRNPLPDKLTYRDTMAVLKSEIPSQQTAGFAHRLRIFPDARGVRPRTVPVRLTTEGFFDLFRAPFRYGSGWDARADAGPEPVVVITRELNDALFGGQNSVGQSLRLETRQFRVLGVLDDWTLPIKYYDLAGGMPLTAIESVFMPLGWMTPMEIIPEAGTSNWRPEEPGFQGFLASERNCLQLWVELRSAEQKEHYGGFLSAYISEQKKLGRFQRPVNYRLTPILELIDERQVIPPQTAAMEIVGYLFLGVCALNLMGLLLSKFFSRSAEVGVRRALGAGQREIFFQLLIECELLAIIGGAIGVVLCGLGLRAANSWMQLTAERGDMFRWDAHVLGVALASALAAGLLAGAYPAWCICRTAPAQHLKLQ